jgi:hypothetical protein
MINKRQNITDAALTEVVKRCLPADAKLWMIIDSCFSGGMLNVFNMEDRTDKKVVAFSGGTSETFAFSGFLTPAFVNQYERGLTAAELASRMFKQIEYTRGIFMGLQVKYSRPLIAGMPINSE